MMASLGLQIDANGIPGAVLAQIGQATGISIVMDHFASEGNTFTPSDAWMQDMQAAAAYPGLHIKVSDVETLSEAGVGRVHLWAWSVPAHRRPHSILSGDGVSVEPFWLQTASLGQ